MILYIENHTFGYELQRVAQMFFPGEKVTVSEGAPPADDRDSLCTRLADGLLLAECRRWGLSEFDDLSPADQPADIEHKFGVLLYQILSRATGIRPQWGVLTGIRPVKLFLSRMDAGMDEKALRRHFIDGCLLSEERFSLARETALAERPLLARSTPDSFSLYVSIPFCPTRCAYCSFVSHTVEKAAKLIPDYVDRLCEELIHTAKIASDLHLKLRTVYFGGGTPTTLSAAQLGRVMGVIADHFDLRELWEYTVEAGRPDTIDADKLSVIKAAGADRISINPQTLSDKVLGAIGRKHSAAEVRDAFALARNCGFDNINMDLIAGLPSDTPEGFRASLDGVAAMEPENVTVHTLTVKRAARLAFEEAKSELMLVGGMVDYARRTLAAAGYGPYYLYRQTGSLSSLENVGYAKPGREGLYNIYIMDETHTVLAVGAGASTKLRHPMTGEIERIYNYKYPYEYIARPEAARERKDRVRAFYGQGGI
ncbi:coproporphyrinogen dehydrogenase HemZ [Anaerotruncus rubiinfantis]|uniref:coproporphyrinogen dehydrogenase HemZ n=1 Tax=Anaerotruncus rubiinfantis TaxID=1720200 RepID=UPI0034A1C512